MNNRIYSVIFVCALLLAGSIGQVCNAQLVLCEEDAGQQAITLHNDLADCADTRNAALDRAALLINMAFAIHKLNIELAQGAYDSAISDCNDIDIEDQVGSTICIAVAISIRNADIAAADAALAAAKAARDAAVAAAEAAYNNCVDDAYALFDSCIQCCTGGGGGGGGGRGFGEE